MINLVLVVALILSAVPVGVSAQNDVEYTPEWQVSFDDDIVINYCNKDGTIWVTGLANGDVFLTSHSGEEIAHIEALDTGPVLEVVSDGTTEYIGIVYAHSVYLIHVETLTVWHSVTSSSFEYGCACDDNGMWYITATHNSDKQKSLLFVGTYQHNKVGMWASMGTVKPHTLIAHEGGAWVLAESYGSTARVISVDTTAFPAVSAWPPLSALPDIDTVYNYSVSFLQVISYTAGDTANYEQDIVIHRTSGAAYTENINGVYCWHVYVGNNCNTDYGDIRFFDSSGNTLSYYLWPGYDSATARFTVKIPASHQTSNIICGYGGGGITTSNADNVFLFFDDFPGNAINTSKWHIDKPDKVVVSNGNLHIQYTGINEGVKLLSTSSYTPSIHVQTRLQTYTYLTSIGHGSSDFTGDGSSLSLVSYQPQFKSALYTGPAVYGVWQSPVSATGSGAGTVVPNPPSTWFTQDFVIPAGDYLQAWCNGGMATTSMYTGLTSSYPLHITHHTQYDGMYMDYFLVRKYTTSPPTLVSSSMALSQAPTRTKDFTGSILDTLTYADSVVIQTDSRLYIQAMNSGGVFGTTTDMGILSGTPHALDATYDLSFVIEGRGPTTDIFRHDGTRVGTYDAGGTVNGVSISRGNGLYALSISQDGKWYLFSKDESSMWYLLYSSPVGTVYSGCALTPYGISFGLWDDITLYVYPTEPGTATTPDGYLSLYITKNNKPYGSVSVNVEQDTGGRVWGEPSLHITDTDGVAVVPVMWGRSLRVTVGANEHAEILTPRPSQLEYIIKVPSDVPLRTGANFRSWYDSALQRIHYSYFDTRGKTHVVEFEIIRNSDNTVVKTETFTIPDGDTSMYTGYYQIPPGFTNTSYRIHLTATGSPSFSNTWHQWISGESGVASLPAELSNTLKTGIFMVLLLFIGGIFSYFSGPHGAVVVSLVAAMLVFWGWLPISPAVIMLCVVWAFLGLLGRTSVG
jgi:hypothetical protein